MRVNDGDWGDALALLLLGIVSAIAMCESGCAPPLTNPIDFAEYAPAELGTLEDATGKAAIILAGHTVSETAYCRSEDQEAAVRLWAEEMVASRRRAEEQIRADRYLASVKDAETTNALRQCKQQQVPEALAVGALGGMAACAGVGWGVESSR